MNWNLTKTTYIFYVPHLITGFRRLYALTNVWAGQAYSTLEPNTGFFSWWLRVTLGFSLPSLNVGDGKTSQVTLTQWIVEIGSGSHSPSVHDTATVKLLIKTEKDKFFFPIDNNNHNNGMQNFEQKMYYCNWGKQY